MPSRFFRRCLASLAAQVLWVAGAALPAIIESPVLRAPAEIEPLKAPFPMPALSRPVIPSTVFDIRDYGAKPGGTVSNTAAIARTIQAAAKAGGGVVLVPAGTWLTGPIHLEDNINLHLDDGATLQFSTRFEDYLPAMRSRHEGMDCMKYSSFIYANGKTNIALTGRGTLDAQGKVWWPWARVEPTQDNAQLAILADLIAKGVPAEERIMKLRPAFFHAIFCRNVLVEGPTLRNTAFWSFQPAYCENVIIRSVTVVTFEGADRTPNGDGVDIDSSRNVLIEYCDFNTVDDCICLKAGRYADGMRVNRPTENVIIRHCVTRAGHGGVVIGSETSGGIRNVYAHDCIFVGTDRGIRLKTGRGMGGVVEKCWFENIAMRGIKKQPIHLHMLRHPPRLPRFPVNATTPSFRDMEFTNITCEQADGEALELVGLPEHPMENLRFRHLSLSSHLGAALTDARGLTFDDVTIHAETGPLVHIVDSAAITFTRTMPADGAAPLLLVEGPDSAKIEIVAGPGPRLTKAQVQLGADARPNAVSF